MSLHEDEIAFLAVCGATPEVVEANLAECCRGRIAGDMPAVLGADTVGVDDHCHRVPADVGLDATLERAIAGVLGLVRGLDRVQVSRVRAVRQVRPRSTGKIDHPVEEEVRPLGTVLRQDRVDGLYPLAGFDRINVVEGIETTHIFTAGRGPGVPLIRA